MILFRTVWSKTLRDYRFAILGWGVSLGLSVLVTMVYYGATDESARAAEAEYAQLFRFLGEPVAVGTPAGYTTWHTVGLLPMMLGIWTVLAGSWLVRGDEERGSLDLTLAMPHHRVRVLLEKIAAFITALALMTLLMAAGTVIAEITGADMSVDIAGALLMSVNVSLTALVFGMLALLLSQVFARRVAAAGWAGAVMIASYLLNGT
ncbi:MAG: ABC transporter permease subunit, partial [Nitrososphaerota archaeon]